MYKTPSLSSENAFQRKIVGYQSTAKATVGVTVCLINTVFALATRNAALLTVRAEVCER